MADINDNIISYENTGDSQDVIRSISPISSEFSIKPRNNSLLGVFYGIGMNVNNMIGAGIVSSPGTVWNTVKSPGIVLSLWLIGGIVSMAGSLTYVELGAIHKISGGETKYLQTAYPNPKLLMSYLFSFMFVLVIKPGLLCAILQIGAQYFWYTIKGETYIQTYKPESEKTLSDDDIPELNLIGWYLPFSPFWFVKFLAILLLFVITVYHMLSNRWAAIINQVLAIIKLITYSIIAIAGIYELCQKKEISSNNWKTQLNGNTDIAGYSSAILLIMFAYNGWNNLNYSLDEFRNPEKKLILSNSISVAIVTVIYFLVNVAFISVVPKEQIESKDKIDNDNNHETIAAEFFNQLFGKQFTRIFTFLVLLSIMGTAAVEVWSGSRVIVAAANSDLFPKYSQKLKNWNERFNTPINALLAQFVWCSFLMIFVGGSFSISNFELFSKLASYSYWIFYLATGIGLLLIRRRSENNEVKSFKVPLPVVGIFILGGVFILTFSFIVDKPLQLSPILLSYGFLIIALLSWYFFYYWWDNKKKQRESAIMRIAGNQ
ncbi:amino acid/polyamine transporter I [Rhizophagus diaphanus]|nr:amino acid/polyamine transporter I [Rhizophagus diaphanus] [Rhizophagus sp. MUCL 43196]